MEFTYTDAKESMLGKIMRKTKELERLVEKYKLKTRSILFEVASMIVDLYSTTSGLLPKPTYADWKYIFTLPSIHLPILLYHFHNQFSFPSSYFPIVPAHPLWDTMITLLFAIEPAVCSSPLPLSFFFY